MNNKNEMRHVETFEDEGFVYQLSVEVSNPESQHLYTCSQGEGYQCRWDIMEKKQNVHDIVAVTDDQCEIIIFDSVESAVRGAKDFLSIRA